MSPELKAFYEYHSSLMEPWDGPASIAFTDGTVIGAVLDRNGLRPSRYCVTKDDLVIMASEVGVLDIPAENILIKERLHPGRIFLIDTAQGRIVVGRRDQARARARQHPYAEWLKGNLVDIEDLPESAVSAAGQPRNRRCSGSRPSATRTKICRVLLAPMASERRGSHRVDGERTAPLAVLSDKPRLLYDYFTQVFAQVTNPPLDAIREELVTAMGLDDRTGGEPARSRVPSRATRSRLKYPVIDNVSSPSCGTSYLSRVPFDDACRCCSTRKEGGRGLERADGTAKDLREPRRSKRDYNILILSGSERRSRSARRFRALLATAGVHHHLVLEGTRTRVALVLEIRRSARSAPLRAAPRLRRRRRSIRIWRSRRSTT